MEDLDAAMKAKQLGVETLDSQYSTVKTETTKSHVLQWGDTKITSEVIGEFEAGEYSVPKDIWTVFKATGKKLFKDEVGWTSAKVARKNDFAVGVRDIDLHYLYSKVVTNPSSEN